jgi:hypothetical protein
VARRFAVVDAENRISGFFGVAPDENSPQIALIDRDATIPLNFKGLARSTCYYTGHQPCTEIENVSSEPLPGVFATSEKGWPIRAS